MLYDLTGRGESQPREEQNGAEARNAQQLRDVPIKKTRGLHAPFGSGYSTTVTCIESPIQAVLDKRDRFEFGEAVGRQSRIADHHGRLSDSPKASDPDDFGGGTDRELSYIMRSGGDQLLLNDLYVVLRVL